MGVLPEPVPGAGEDKKDKSPEADHISGNAGIHHPESGMHGIFPGSAALTENVRAPLCDRVPGLHTGADCDHPYLYGLLEYQL